MAWSAVLGVGGGAGWGAAEGGLVLGHVLWFGEVVVLIFCWFGGLLCRRAIEQPAQADASRPGEHGAGTVGD